MYIAAGGYIKRIDNGKLTVIAGPNDTNIGNDGVAALQTFMHDHWQSENGNETYFSSGN
ncbi:hypothetical protein [Mucilaginibacter limnophilus]|uniref:hypothetical protein n=1 Tax=Mucilaginibacter limnophilus TaxID=1932778 RepID=UPI0013E315E5|nr:hypothetical protein [Mucilaginibacter limnophilus]